MVSAFSAFVAPSELSWGRRRRRRRCRREHERSRGSSDATAVPLEERKREGALHDVDRIGADIPSVMTVVMLSRSFAGAELRSGAEVAQAVR